MKYFNIPMMFLPMAMLAIGLSACQSETPDKAPALIASGAEISLSPIEGRPAAAYFTLIAQGRDAVLVGVDIAGAERTMLHQTITENGISKMEASPSFSVKSGEKLVFERGGKHVMVFGLKDVAPEQNVAMTLRFENGETLAVEAIAKALSAPAKAQ